jgi:endoglucanase
MKRRVRTGFVVLGFMAHVTMASAGAGVLVNRHVVAPHPPATTAPAPTTASPRPPACLVTFTRRDQWATGFTADVVVTNLGDRIEGWELRYRSLGVRVVQGWNGAWTQQGDQVSVRNMPWNDTLEPGGSVKAGVSAAFTGESPPPTRFSLNDAPCVVN